MKTRFGFVLGGLVLLAAIFLAAPKEANAAFGETSPPLGKECVVQFRRDALGAAANLPIAPMTGSINGAQTAISGKLKMVTAEWIVINDESGDVWVSKHSVLLLKF